MPEKCCVILLTLTGNAVGPHSVITLTQTLLPLQVIGAIFAFTDQLPVAQSKECIYSVNF